MYLFLDTYICVPVYIYILYICIYNVVSDYWNSFLGGIPYTNNTMNTIIDATNYRYKKYKIQKVLFVVGHI